MKSKGVAALTLLAILMSSATGWIPHTIGKIL
jgi:hypothetical protein